MLCWDLSKAFDTVDHNIIKLKLKSLGVKESSITWFSSYLCNRSQYMTVDNVMSDPEHTSCGVPQGSILGPLLFVCYINDMPKFCGDLRPFIYADDMALLTKNKSLEVINATLQQYHQLV